MDRAEFKEKLNPLVKAYCTFVANTIPDGYDKDQAIGRITESIMWVERGNEIAEMQAKEKSKIIT